VSVGRHVAEDLGPGGTHPVDGRGQLRQRQDVAQPRAEPAVDPHGGDDFGSRERVATPRALDDELLWIPSGGECTSLVAHLAGQLSSTTFSDFLSHLPQYQDFKKSVQQDSSCVVVFSRFFR
jgi:hypothetical protein